MREKNGEMIKNCALFRDCISKMNNSQVDNAKYIEVVITRCNVIEYSNKYWKTWGTSWQYYRDEPNSKKLHW